MRADRAAANAAAPSLDFQAPSRTASGRFGANDKAERLAASLAGHLDDARGRRERLSRRPKLFFEEWDDPLISGIGWVSELVEVAGSIDIFADRARCGAARDRIVAPEEVVARAPDLIIGSWCGKRFRPEKVAVRPGFGDVPVVRKRAVYEVKSSLILQPGPAALTDGLAALQGIIERWAGESGPGTSTPVT